MMRLMLLGAFNSTKGWYQPGDKTAATIGLTFIKFLRQAMEA